MKRIAATLALAWTLLSCRTWASDIGIFNRIVIDHKTLSALITKPKTKPKIKVDDRFLNCSIGDRIAWALLTNKGVDYAEFGR